MKVMVIVKASKSSEAGEMPSEELLAAMGKYNEELVNAGIMLAGEGLHPSKNGFRVRFSGASRIVTDGPFAETKELIAGFWLWRVQSMEEAIAWVKRCPNPMPEDSDIEIRQVFDADDFGDALTPELREQEAVLRAQTLGLGKPRFEIKSPRLIVGLSRHYTLETRSNIPVQWQQFVPQMNAVNAKNNQAAYGVIWNSLDDCSFDYLSGVEVSDSKNLPEGFISLQLPEQRYAVFVHSKPVAVITDTINTIWTEWAPDSGLTLSENAPCVEYYGENFNPETGLGDIEIWIPVATSA
jgi:AraC family transcriptional regulator